MLRCIRFRGLLVDGGEVTGPAIIVGPGTAVVVPEKAVARPLGTEAIEVSCQVPWVVDREDRSGPGHV